jgi:hypothetical protein
MSYDKNATPKYCCTTSKGSTFLAVSIPSVKRQASKLLNGYRNVLDSVNVHDYETGILVATLRRINRKAPNNTITYGKWN